LTSSKLTPLRGRDSKPPICHPSPDPPPGYCAGNLTPAWQAVPQHTEASGTLFVDYTDHPATLPVQITWLPDLGTVRADTYAEPGQTVNWQWDVGDYEGNARLVVIFQGQKHPPCIYIASATWGPTGP